MQAWYKYAIKPKQQAQVERAGGRDPVKVPSIALELLVLKARESLQAIRHRWAQCGIYRQRV